MTPLLARLGALALQGAAALPDTIVTKQVEQPRDWFNTVSGIASIVISIALSALAIGLLPAAFNFRKSYKKINELLDRVYGDINPIARNASVIADNVNFVTTAARADYQLVHQTLVQANDRLLQAIDETERRMQEFNALLGVVQEEAEGVFVSTASALRGVRDGAATFRDDARAFHDGLAAGPPLDDDDDGFEVAMIEVRPLGPDAYDAGPGSARSFSEEFEDAVSDEGPADSSAGEGIERPRVRPRRGTAGPA